MQIDLDVGQWIVILLSALLFIWYFLANSANRRKGIATYRWLRQGLDSLGNVSSAEWIGASNVGARMVVAKPAKPFRRVEARYLLEPREFLPYWFFSYLRGKRDEVVIKITLRMNPSSSLEIRRFTGRKNVPAGECAHQHFQVVRADLADPQLISHVEAFLDENGATINEIILQNRAPHIELNARLGPLLDCSPELYFAKILSWYQPS